MGLFEWLIERHNPHPTGTVDIEPPEPLAAPPRSVFLRGVIALAALGYVVYAIATSSEPVGFSIAAALYFAAAYWLLPKPEVSNLGLWGTPIDHPFRWSDDANRMLLFLRFFLWPGRAILSGLRDALTLARTYGMP